MSTTALTGKSFTFSYGGVTGTAQITTGTVDESASSTTIQTLGGSVAVSEGVESTVSCDFLYDGPEAASFYAALKTALDAGTAGAIAIAGGVSKWDGQGIVTALSAEFPADGASTCSAEFTISGKLAFDGDGAP
jgi:hypothetical protein